MPTINSQSYRYASSHSYDQWSSNRNNLVEPQNKSRPYCNDTKKYRDNPFSLNCTVNFPGADKKIVCRHLATQFVYDALNHLDGKINYEHYHTGNNIASHVLPGLAGLDADKIFDRLLMTGEKSLVDKTEFSNYLRMQFELMDKNNETKRVFFISTAYHAMAMVLRIKIKKGEAAYVVKVYDPNLTDKTTRCASKQIHGFDVYTLQDFFLKNEAEMYFPGDSEHLALIARISEKTLDPSALPSLDLVYTPDEILLHPTACYFLLKHNIANELSKLPHLIRDRYPHLANDLLCEELMKMLMKTRVGDVSGFFSALRYGHVEVLEESAKLLKGMLANIPKNKLIQVIDVKHPDGGISAVYLAKQQGHTHALAAYDQLLKLLFDTEQSPSDIALKYLPDNVSNTYTAQQRHSSSVQQSLYSPAQTQPKSSIDVMRSLQSKLLTDLRVRIAMRFNEPLANEPIDSNVIAIWPSQAGTFGVAIEGKYYYASIKQIEEWIRRYIEPENSAVANGASTEFTQWLNDPDSFIDMSSGKLVYSRKQSKSPIDTMRTLQSKLLTDLRVRIAMRYDAPSAQEPIDKKVIAIWPTSQAGTFGVAIEGNYYEAPIEKIEEWIRRYIEPENSAVANGASAEFTQWLNDPDSFIDMSSGKLVYSHR